MAHMDYLNQYRESICYDNSGLINLNMRRANDAEDFLERQKQEKYSSENVFPTYKDGPQKGKIIHVHDDKGNIVIDPTSLVRKDPFLIDFHLYSRYKKMAEKGRIV